MGMHQTAVGCNDLRRSPSVRIPNRGHRLAQQHEVLPFNPCGREQIQTGHPSDIRRRHEFHLFRQLC
jgi:hypothetical protein